MKHLRLRVRFPPESPQLASAHGFACRRVSERRDGSRHPKDSSTGRSSGAWGGPWRFPGPSLPVLPGALAPPASAPQREEESAAADLPVGGIFSSRRHALTLFTSAQPSAPGGE